MKWAVISEAVSNETSPLKLFCVFYKIPKPALILISGQVKAALYSPACHWHCLFIVGAEQEVCIGVFYRLSAKNNTLLLSRLLLLERLLIAAVSSNQNNKGVGKSLGSFRCNISSVPQQLSLWCAWMGPLTATYLFGVAERPQKAEAAIHTLDCVQKEIWNLEITSWSFSEQLKMKTKIHWMDKPQSASDWKTLLGQEGRICSYKCFPHKTEKCFTDVSHDQK